LLSISLSSPDYPICFFFLLRMTLNGLFLCWCAVKNLLSLRAMPISETRVAFLPAIYDQYDDWCTGRWLMDCYIWYSEEGPWAGCGCTKRNNPLVNGHCINFIIYYSTWQLPLHYKGLKPSHFVSAPTPQYFTSMQVYILL